MNLVAFWVSATFISAPVAGVAWAYLTERVSGWVNRILRKAPAGNIKALGGLVCTPGGLVVDAMLLCRVEGKQGLLPNQ